MAVAMAFYNPPNFKVYERMLITGEDIKPTQESDEYAKLAVAVSVGNFQLVFQCPFAQVVFGIIPDDIEENFDWISHINQQIATVFSQEGAEALYKRNEKILQLLLLGIAGLNAFVQSNITGPPLSFVPTQILLGGKKSKKVVKTIRRSIIKRLSIEGEAVYHLIPDAILFALAKAVFNNPILLKVGKEWTPSTCRWWRLRVNFLHQKLLQGEKTDLLHDLVYEDVNYLARPEVYRTWTQEARSRFLVEKALIDTFFGYDNMALQELETASNLTGLKYALTGILGKRTKFQEKETSQLVVFAKSQEDKETLFAQAYDNENATVPQTKPKILDLNDDTLLERIEFTLNATSVHEVSDLSPELANLEPNNQPPLHPLDACILLLVAETIKNTNPVSGITREEMAPYAERVLQHSTNWEVYTIGLLVRSRIEGYKVRTAERGVLQLQALVDQIVAQTASAISSKDDEVDLNGAKPTTFLPAPESESEFAPARDRLQYVYQLPCPTRWELEAELANRWVALGALRTALEIYERLEMWAEVALCWAATEREDQAKKVIRDQLFIPIVPPPNWEPAREGGEYIPTQEEEDSREEKLSAPSNAPRLWCILGDIDNNPAHYERSWEISGGRYARAKRSLGKYYFGKKEFLKSAEAYAESLRINALNGQSWFALGCCRMELEDWEGAVECFSRTVSLDDQDAEAWSNLASALLRRRTTLASQKQWKYGEQGADEEEVEAGEISEKMDNPGEAAVDVRRNRLDAIKALRRACSLKYDNWRIWENFLIISASINQYNGVVLAMKRIIELQGKSRGESCIDVEILERLIRHVITTDLDKREKPTATTAFYTETDRIASLENQLQKSTIDLVETLVIPLITKTDRLWSLVSKLALWRNRPKEALDAQEKGFRAVIHGFDVGERKWEELVEATTEMASAYENLGQMERTGLGSGSGELVMKDWKFKARTAVRGVIGKGKKVDCEGTEGMGRLEDVLEALKV